MTLSQLRRRVLPCTVEIDSSGCVIIDAPKGKHFNCGMHSLVTDPKMMEAIPETKRELYKYALDDYKSELPLEPCGEECGEI